MVDVYLSKREQGIYTLFVADVFDCGEQESLFEDEVDPALALIGLSHKIAPYVFRREYIVLRGMSVPALTDHEFKCAKEAIVYATRDLESLMKPMMKRRNAR